MKPATSIALAQLVSQGELALDQPVSHFVPGFAQNNKEHITLRHLLTHTSGVELFAPAKLASAQELLDDVCRRRPHSAPGTQAAYWTFGAWVLLGTVIETVVGRPLSAHIRDRVFLPLGMEDSFVGMTGEQWTAVVDRLGVSYVDVRGMDLDFVPAAAAAAGVGVDQLPALTEDGFVPMEWEASERACASTLPEQSGYAPTDMARFYDALLRPDELAQRGILDADILRVFTSAQRRGMYDLVLLRVCDFGLGIMVNVRDHQLVIVALRIPGSSDFRGVIVARRDQLGRPA
ncbi:MAG TPA: serine hydrolase domain-containing protein [Acidimicrobiales bacterium]|nr:serine hydrolase domain-containing protein [Acidimicrobiales bacterium]